MFKANKTPLYLQVKNYISKNINDQIWPVGFKLPPERELAKELEVSRKTVSMAYSELVKEGILSSHQGRGTFVIEKPLSNVKIFDAKNEEDMKQLTKNIDQCIERSLKIGMNLDDFELLCEKRIKEYKNEIQELKLIFIECNKEQLDYFCEEIGLGSGIKITPILLQDFKRNIEKINKKLNLFDLVVTTVFHYEEVRSLIQDDEVEILPIALNPQIESIIKIARIRKEKKVGILCKSQNFAEKVKRAIQEIGLQLSIDVTTTLSEKNVKNFVVDLDVIIVSPGRKKDVMPFISDKQEVIEFIFVPDVGSINLLKTAILKKTII
ncbi:MAG TPA: winged helix-turn-helix transcriptional regulator [Thermoanaerobacterales bacterium]|nr:winged helix-turn-helix transcriptional regulator [Thermoanaerobacterales bacterium]